MAQKTGSMETGGEQVRLPTGVMLRPPVTAEELKADTEYDPEGADEFWRSSGRFGGNSLG